jgi:hypothetical protein
MMTSAPRPDQELTTWKEIASYLGVGVRTAQEYESQLGLPVHRLARRSPRADPKSSPLVKAALAAIRDVAEDHGSFSFAVPVISMHASVNFCW